MASRYFSWHDSQIHYIRRGMGDPLLLVHNVYPGASHEEFEHNVDELARHFTVHAIDLLGFGESSAPRIKYTGGTYCNLLLDFLRNETGPAHVMATGLSCAYVTEVAVWRPGLVKNLVYVCPRSEPTGLDTPRWMAAIQRVLLTSRLGSSVYETLSCKYELRSYLEGCFHDPKHVHRDQVERLHEQATRPDSVYACASLMTGFLDSDILKSLPHVTSPILLLWGHNARPTPVEHSVRFSSISRDCRLHVLEKAGSWPHHEQSAKVNRLIVQHLNNELVLSENLVTA
jgi:pimeloyl-ACP methyl ester carboxylesterase